MIRQIIAEAEIWLKIPAEINIMINTTLLDKIFALPIFSSILFKFIFTNINLF